MLAVDFDAFLLAGHSSWNGLVSRLDGPGKQWAQHISAAQRTNMLCCRKDFRVSGFRAHWSHPVPNSCTPPSLSRLGSSNPTVYLCKKSWRSCQPRTVSLDCCRQMYKLCSQKCNWQLYVASEKQPKTRKLGKHTLKDCWNHQTSSNNLCLLNCLSFTLPFVQDRLTKLLHKRHHLQ